MSFISSLVGMAQAIGADIKVRLVKPIANGFISHAGDALTAARTITGTANKISVTDGDGVSNNPVISIPDNPVLSGTASLTIPSGTSAERDTPSAAKIRHNAQIDRYEASIGGNYVAVGAITQVISNTIASVSGTAQIPFDNTPPLITEGFPLLNITITPKVANSRQYLSCNLNVDHSANNRTITATVWVDTALIYTFSVNVATAGRPLSLPVDTWFDSVDVSPKNIQIRVGANGNGTTYIGAAPVANLGGNRVMDYSFFEVLNNV